MAGMDEASARQGVRYQDPGTPLFRLAERVLVRCPRCAARAIVLAHAGTPEHRRAPGPGGQWETRRRLLCGACGLARDEFLCSWEVGRPVDPYFRTPLWLRADCRGGRTLWAYNAEHLDILESYVTARLRERPASPAGMTMLEHLPAWLKAAGHRDEVVRTLRRLRATLPGG